MKYLNLVRNLFSIASFFVLVGCTQNSELQTADDGKASERVEIGIAHARARFDDLFVNGIRIVGEKSYTEENGANAMLGKNIEVRGKFETWFGHPYSDYLSGYTVHKFASLSDAKIKVLPPFEVKSFSQIKDDLIGKIVVAEGMSAKVFGQNALLFPDGFLPIETDKKWPNDFHGKIIRVTGGLSEKSIFAGEGTNPFIPPTPYVAYPKDRCSVQLTRLPYREKSDSRFEIQEIAVSAPLSLKDFYDSVGKQVEVIGVSRNNGKSPLIISRNITFQLDGMPPWPSECTDREFKVVGELGKNQDGFKFYFPKCLHFPAFTTSSIDALFWGRKSGERLDFSGKAVILEGKSMLQLYDGYVVVSENEEWAEAFLKHPLVNVSGNLVKLQGDKILLDKVNFWIDEIAEVRNKSEIQQNKNTGRQIHFIGTAVNIKDSAYLLLDGVPVQLGLLIQFSSLWPDEKIGTKVGITGVLVEHKDGDLDLLCGIFDDTSLFIYFRDFEILDDAFRLANMRIDEKFCQRIERLEEKFPFLSTVFPLGKLYAATKMLNYFVENDILGDLPS